MCGFLHLPGKHLIAMTKEFRLFKTLLIACSHLLQVVSERVDESLMKNDIDLLTKEISI